MGKVYEYDVPKAGGGTTKKQVQQQLNDQSHGPHYEAGTPKPGGQQDAIGRDRLQMANQNRIITISNNE